MSGRIISIIIGLVVLLAAVFVWSPASVNHHPPREGAGLARTVGSEVGMSQPSAPMLPSEPPVTIGEKFNSPRSDIQSDLRTLAGMLATYRSNFAATGNPEGDNRQITAALRGKNPLHIALIPLDHPAINLVGELCDRWGTPFLFRAESSTRMEIRSAGPDQKMFTDDDVVQKP